MADKGSLFSRVVYKVLEIVGAAVATAVSGYLVAHLGGFLPSQTHTPTPPAVVVAPAPNERAVAKSNPANVPVKEPTASPLPTQSAAVPAAAEGRPTQAPAETTGSGTPPVSKSSKSKTAATPPSKKSAKAEPATAPDANRPRETADTKPRETTADPKPRGGDERDSVEALARAALDAHPPPADVLPRRDNQGAQSRPGDTSPATTAAIPPRPIDSPQAAATGSTEQPRSADLGSPMQQAPAPQSPATQSAPTVAAPVQITPVQPTAPQQPDALTSVEIKSRPVATIDTAPAPEAQPREEDRGVMSFFHRILPDLRRPASADEAPRPPAAVGQ